MKLPRLISEVARVIYDEARALVQLDVVSALVVLIFLGFFLPTIARYAENASMLASFIDDEPFIVMQVDGMTTRPYGNPANYLDKRHVVPQHWGNIRYDGLIYYGGLYPDIAFAVWVPLKLAGAAIFPTLPVAMRAIALVFTVASLLAIYNIARSYMGRMAALIAILYMATCYHLITIGTIIHPDSLLFFLTLLVLALCVRHARDGAVESLLAMGVVAGLAQAAKMGGPPLVPIVVLSIFAGLTQQAPAHSRSGGWMIRQVLGKGLVVASVAFAVFLVATPYAVVDSYFYDSWKTASQIFTSGSPTGQTDFANWCLSFYGEVGPICLSACVLALAGHFFYRRDVAGGLPIAFFALLALSIFLWFAALQRIWVQLQYLVITFAFVVAGAGYLLDQLSNRLFPLLSSRPRRAATLGVTVSVLFVLLMEPQLYRAAVVSMGYAGWRHSPQMQVGAWLQERQPNAGGSVLIDNQAYFDPRAFSAQFHNGGPITYTKLAEVLPDYFVLTVHYMNNWMSKKMGSQRNDKWDDAYDSMKLYQDLLGNDFQRITVQEHAPGIGFIKDFGAHARKIDGVEPVNWENGWDLIFNHSDILASRSTSIFLFRLDQTKFVESIPAANRHLSAKAFASSTAPNGYDVKNVLADDTMVWVSAKSGTDIVGEYVGIDYGKIPVEPIGLSIRWVGYNWRPKKIEVEFSDNAGEWQSAGIFPLAIPANPPVARINGSERWEETFALPPIGKHRYWRVVAREAVEGGHFFGVERLRFDLPGG